MTQKKTLERVPAVRAGDRILRRQRKPRGILHTISRRIRRSFKSITRK